MTRPEITTEIEELQKQADEARENGNDPLLYRTICKIQELQGAMGVQQHEFAGGYE